MTNITLEHYLLISIILFTLGVFAVLTRRNAITILMGIELILNSCNINFIAFSRFISSPTTMAAGEVSLAIEGQIMALFVIVLAAAEAAVFLAIILSIYREFSSISPSEIDTLKG